MITKRRYSHTIFYINKFAFIYCFIQEETEPKLWSDFDDDFFGSDEETDEFFKDDNNKPDREKTDFKKQVEEDECDMTNNPAQFGYFLGL